VLLLVVAAVVVVGGFEKKSDWFLGRAAEISKIAERTVIIII